MAGPAARGALRALLLLGAGVVGVGLALAVSGEAKAAGHHHLTDTVLAAVAPVAANAVHADRATPFAQVIRAAPAARVVRLAHAHHHHPHRRVPVAVGVHLPVRPAQLIGRVLAPLAAVRPVAGVVTAVRYTLGSVVTCQVGALRCTLGLTGSLSSGWAAPLGPRPATPVPLAARPRPAPPGPPPATTPPPPATTPPPPDEPLIGPPAAPAPPSNPPQRAAPPPTAATGDTPTGHGHPIPPLPHPGALNRLASNDGGGSSHRHTQAVLPAQWTPYRSTHGSLTGAPSAAAGRDTTPTPPTG